MKSILTIIFVLMSNVMIFSAPILNHNAFSATPDNNQNQTTETSVTGKDKKPVTDTKEEVKPASNTQPAKSTNGDYKLLQRSKKRLEYKYKLYA